jgi:TonB family protein
VARQARIQGEVHLQVMVNADGKIISVESSAGPDILAAQAKSNIRQWSYDPTGEPIKLEVIYTFRLEKPEMTRTPRPRVVVESPVHIIVTSNLPKTVG